ncbi:DyP-type peroxidase [Auriculariales sp. MPI-PUGE-AT-0066]|nr:DyP-type peroxidase [Auriculariales sp. MPI-PUGE-AT-0066]
MRKNLQLFYFFQIDEAASFKQTLNHETMINLITPVSVMLDPGTQPQVAVNIAFSQAGLQALGITGDLQDEPFANGQMQDASNLGDPGTTNWKPTFTDPSNLHGVFIIASDKQIKIDAMVATLELGFGKSQHNLYKLQGNVRPPPFACHEHFGWLDGIGQPAVSGFQTAFTGQQQVDPGVILVGESGDPSVRPAWAKDGSFLAFRELQQLVPEFAKFVTDNAPPVPGEDPKDYAGIFGARLFGRWKSGAPTFIASRADDLELANDPQRNNAFNYTRPAQTSLQISLFVLPRAHTHCSKARPRADNVSHQNSIYRASIPFGTEVTPAEQASHTSDPTSERGLAFVAYQSGIAAGFQFLQKMWLNNPRFATGKNVDPGFDPILGANHGEARYIKGAYISNPTEAMNIPNDFIVSRGGEYFFAPSISAIRDTISV